MKRYLSRGVCVLLAVLLLAGATTVLLSAERQIPAASEQTPAPLTPDRMLTDREPPSAPPETEPTEPPTEPETQQQTLPATEESTERATEEGTEPASEPMTEPSPLPTERDDPAPSPEPEQPHIVTELVSRVWTPDTL